MVTRYRVIKLSNLEKVEDRAIEGLIIPQERLLSMESQLSERLFDAYYDSMVVPDSRSLTKKMHDHQEYEYALVVTEYINKKPFHYAIYKGEREECYRERNRFEESMRNPEGYRQKGNGTKRRNLQ